MPYSSSKPFNIFIYEKPEDLVLVCTKENIKPFFLYIKSEESTFGEYIKDNEYCLYLSPLPYKIKYIKEE